MQRRVMALVALAVIGCGNGTDPSGFALEFAASSRQITHGIPITFTLRVTNLTGETVALTGSGSCTFRWEQAEVHQVQACTDDLQTWRFEPLQTRTFTFQWDGYLYDIEGMPFAAEPGTYNARGVLDANEVQGMSAAVEITVRAADAPTTL